MTSLPRTRQIGPDYWTSYFRGRHIDLYRNGKEWVSFAGGLGAERHTATTKVAALRAAMSYILDEERSEVS